jgi:hypothetical protein
MNKTEKKNTDTKNENTDTKNENTDKKRALLIKLLMSSFVNSDKELDEEELDEEELMDAFDNQNKMPWSCDK